MKERRTDSPSPPRARLAGAARRRHEPLRRRGRRLGGVSPDGAIKKGTWAPAEDALLRNLVDEHGARRGPAARARARPPPTTPGPFHTPRGPRKVRGAAAFESLTRPPPLHDLLPRLPPPRRLAALSWAMIATKMPGRTGKQCRERCATTSTRRSPGALDRGRMRS